MDALSESKDPMSPQEIANVSEQSYSNVRFLLHKMAKLGEVRKEGRGKYVHPDNPSFSPPNITNNANNGDDWP